MASYTKVVFSRSHMSRLLTNSTHRTLGWNFSAEEALKIIQSLPKYAGMLTRWEESFTTRRVQLIGRLPIFNPTTEKMMTIDVYRARFGRVPESWCKKHPEKLGTQHWKHFVMSSDVRELS